MSTQRLTSTYYGLTHGWHEFVIIYLIFAIFSVIGLNRGRASLRQYLFSPITSLLTLVVVALLSEIPNWILRNLLHLKLRGINGDLVGVVIIMFGGFAGGKYWASRGQPLKAMHGRGAVVFDGAEAQRHARRLNSNAKRGQAAPLTIAGVSVPFEDETKHFKFMGTTGAGKATAMRELLDGVTQGTWCDPR